MATIPVYGPQRANVGGSVGPGSVIQRQAAPASSFGVAARNEGAVGQAVANLGGAFDAMAEKARKIRAEENLVAYQRERNEILMNPDSGYYNKKGRDAYDGREDTLKQLEDLRKKRAESIQDPLSRELFTTASDRMQLQDEEQTMEFAARNFDAWQKAVSQQRVELSITDATRDWRNPEQLAIDFELGKQSIIDMNEGMGAEYINGEINQYAGAFYRGVVEAAITSSVTEGEAMMKEFDGFLDSNDEYILQQRLDTKKKAEEAQFYAATAVNKGTNLVNDYYLRPDARNRIIDEVNKITDPKLRDLTMSEAMTGLNQRQQAQDEERAVVYENSVSLMVNNGWTVPQIMAANPEAWNKMTGVQQAALWKAQADGGEVKTDLDVWTAITQAPDSELLALTGEDLQELQTKLSPTDYKQTVDHIQDLKSGKGETRIGWTRNAQATAVMKQIFGDSKGNVELDAQSAFYATLQGEYTSRKEQLGRDLTNEETDKLFNDLTIKYVTERSWLGIPMGKREQSLEDVPVGQIQFISEQLREQGYEVTAPNIIQFYNQNKEALGE